MVADSPSREAPGYQAAAAQHHRDLVKWTRGVAIFTGLLFVANVASNFFIWQQWRVMVNAQRDTREQLRAVISQNGGFTVFLHDNDQKLTGVNFVAQFQNNGGTRTARFRGWISAHYFDDIPNNLDLSRPYTSVDITDRIIGPNTTYQLGPAGIPADDAAKLIAKKGVGLVWGRVEYSDIFDPDKMHPVSFCMLVNMPSDGQNESSLRMSPYRSDCNQSQ
jgi:hypothetical protein